MKEKVFVISFMKSGITTATKFLKQSGYKHKFPIPYNANALVSNNQLKVDMFDKIVARGDFFTDQPIFVLWEHIAKRYPNSKFICTYRDVDSWYGSFKNWSVKRNLMPDTKVNIFSYWLQRPDLLKFRTSQEMLEQCEKEGLGYEIKKRYLDHNKNIKKHFEGRSNLFFAPIDRDNTIELRNFLNIENSEVEWGHYNKAQY